MDTLTTQPKTCRRRAIKNKDKLKTVTIDQPDTQEFHGLVLSDPVETFGEVAFANGKLVYESFVFQKELSLECLVKDEPVEQPIEQVEQPIEQVEQPIEQVERVQCLCGSQVTKKSLTKHLKTAKHLNNIPAVL